MPGNTILAIADYFEGNYPGPWAVAMPHAFVPDRVMPVSVRVLTTAVSTDARREVKHVAVDNIVSGGQLGLRFEVRHEAAAPTGPYQSSIVDCIDSQTEERLQLALVTIPNIGATRRLLHALGNMAINMTIEAGGKLSPMQQQIDWLIALDKLLWKAVPAPHGFFLCAALVRGRFEDAP